MMNHLTHEALSALADDELSSDQLLSANLHLAECPSCTSSALAQSLLKSATAKAGQRYAPPPHLAQRLPRQTQRPASRGIDEAEATAPISPHWRTLGWAAAAALLIISASIWFARGVPHGEFAASQSTTLVAELCDQHIAALAPNAQPQVISSDRHTIKPWFQGKLPFSFNLPDGLPQDTVLDGANLAYLHFHPTAQLLYSIGQHRVSIFVRRRTGSGPSRELLADYEGFHVNGFRNEELEVLAVSDVEPARLSALVARFKSAQTPPQDLPR